MRPPAISTSTTLPSDIATGPSGNFRPLASSRTSAIRLLSSDRGTDRRRANHDSRRGDAHDDDRDRGEDADRPEDRAGGGLPRGRAAAAAAVGARGQPEREGDDAQDDRDDRDDERDHRDDADHERGDGAAGPPALADRRRVAIER